MKALVIIAVLGVLGVRAQTPAQASKPEIKGDTVVAVVNGKKVTAGQIDNFILALPPNVQSNFQRNKKEFMRQYGFLDHLTTMAEKAKVEETSPVKERLVYTRMQVLAQAILDDNSNRIAIMEEERRAAYEKDKQRHTQAKIKVIYLPFSPNAPAVTDPAAVKVMSEDEAKAKTEGLLKQIRAGADFGKLAREHSKDPNSAEKDGDFGVVRRSDNLPDAIKNVVFGLKKGEVSEPVRQPNGFYLFRVEDIVVRPYDEVKDDIHKELRQASFQKWFDKTRADVDVKFENEAFFVPETPAAAGAK